ncbi:M7gpppn-mRNA hydrolase [Plakobranchus ocellatus]|uniref:mRNA-decapping enzyme 2 n=1 Tax=Plakobranchus ocellatus TaxID=259542 RepID=A0AAV4AZ35_9GAST|nr:M7gpppn-mRNA hydrolase [Plakobranchus ocellatus]
METSGKQRQKAQGFDPNKLIPSYVLDDLSSRFIINSRPEEIQSSARLFFLIENAYWFYLDFHCVGNSQLKDCAMKEFAFCLINHCPVLNKYIQDFDKHFESWKQYKRTIQTCGAIILDHELKYILLVQSFSSKNSWGFPKGKINPGELPAQCAIREVLEETGFDITQYLVPDEYLERVSNEQTSLLYIIPGISIDTIFLPKTRREIRDIQWFPIDTLPSYRGDQTLKEAVGQNLNLYTVLPYIKHLKIWIKTHLESGSSNKSKSRQKQQKQSVQPAQNPSQENLQSKKGKGTAVKNTTNPQRGSFVRYSKDIIDSQEKTEKKGRRGMTVFQTLFGNKDAQAQPMIAYKAPEVDTDFFYSKAWYNFRLDTDAIMELLPHEGTYYYPKSYTSHKDLVGHK